MVALETYLQEAYEERGQYMSIETIRRIIRFNNDDPNSEVDEYVKDDINYLLDMSENTQIPEHMDTYVQDPFKGCVKLQKRRVNNLLKPSSKNASCGICLCDEDEDENGDSDSDSDSDSDGEGCFHLPCGHDFHRECITVWLTTSRASCPMCNKKFL
jgi:RING-H2 zinc finger domain